MEPTEKVHMRKQKIGETIFANFFNPSTFNRYEGKYSVFVLRISNILLQKDSQDQFNSFTFFLPATNLSSMIIYRHRKLLVIKFDRRAAELLTLYQQKKTKRPTIILSTMTAIWLTTRKKVMEL